MIIQEGVKDPSDLAIIGNEDYAYSIARMTSELPTSEANEVMHNIFAISF